MWIFHTKASDAQLWYYHFDLHLNKRLSENREAGDLRRHRAHYHVIVMRNNIPAAHIHVETKVMKIGLISLYLYRRKKHND